MLFSLYFSGTPPSSSSSSAESPVIIDTTEVLVPSSWDMVSLIAALSSERWLSMYSRTASSTTAFFVLPKKCAACEMRRSVCWSTLIGVAVVVMSFRSPTSFLMWRYLRIRGDDSMILEVPKYRKFLCISLPLFHPSVIRV